VSSVADAERRVLFSLGPVVEVRQRRDAGMRTRTKRAKMMMSEPMGQASRPGWAGTVVGVNVLFVRGWPYSSPSRA
jgi:hypothetical protein